MRTLIIGEMGSTPEGNLGTMKRLIECAADCGADVVKNQWTSSAERWSDRRHAPGYLDSYRLLQYPLGWHAELRAYAKERGMQYACTAYIPGDSTVLAPFVDYLKISSFEAEDHALLDEAIKTMPFEHVIASYGMGADWYRAGCLHLACTSAYPAPISALNLRRMVDKYGERAFDGFSDHSHDVRVGAWAVAAGAEILETHFRLDDCDPLNKDYAVAFTPAEFALYVRNVRDCEAALGSGVKAVQECEREMERFKVKA